MSEENKQLIHRWFEEVWNQPNSSAIDEMLTEETIHHGLGAVEKNRFRELMLTKHFIGNSLLFFLS